MTLTKIKDNHWEYRENGELVDFKLEGNKVIAEAGPEEATPRAHEINGATQEINEFIENPYRWINEDYPGLHALICAELRKVINS